jgi:peroxiredoxin
MRLILGSASMVDPYTLPDDLPRPIDDGAADRLEGAVVPPLELAATDGSTVRLDQLEGLAIVYAYPWTGRPGEPLLVDGWDLIPGARGCTPETCAFRDHHADLLGAGASAVYGLSTQETAYQRELADRLHLPFPILSDAELKLTRALDLPTFEVAGRTLIKRLTLAIRDGRIERVWYPVFPPDTHASEVLADLRTI